MAFMITVLDEHGMVIDQNGPFESESQAWSEMRVMREQDNFMRFTEDTPEWHYTLSRIKL